MHSPEQLFPIRQTRRDFLRAGVLGTAALALGEARGLAEAPAAKARIGTGRHAFELDASWGGLPQGMKYGYGCAVVADGRDRIFVTSRSIDPCVAIFDREGQLLETWSGQFTDKVGFTAKQYAATAHGLYWSKEPEGEFLYWTENVAQNPDKTKYGARVYKTDLEGKVLYTLGPGVKASSNSAPFDFVNPTDVAIGPAGQIYVVDGYGSQLVHQFDRSFRPVRTIGGKGKEHGQFNTCHGVWVNTLRSEPEVYIADRANHRIEVYSLDLKYKRSIADLRLPCCFYQQGGYLYVPELDARVSVLDPDDAIVARLGDGKAVKKEEIRSHPEVFAAPHAVTLDSRGNLFVIEWLDFGRPRKFRPLAG